ncbi:unnamed protein product [Caenorhabditis auriculariae]|uniref:Uncharacterized protein n=1 Tax=Caenorhabditis auriculariae TaxID=2777116 RepID=A0A8S1HQZ7_9PELO|nr:unnamed protein product [Caenorhabditis auriculariae]
MLKSVLVAILVAQATVALNSATDELTKLVDQVNPEITTFLSKTQLTEFFVTFGKIFNSNKTMIQMAPACYYAMEAVMTQEQRQEAKASLLKAKDSYGGFDKVHVLVFRGLDAIHKFFGPTLEKDRADFREAEKSGKSMDEVSALVYERLQQYWNVEFGQLLIDNVKVSMTPTDWAIAIKDAPQYINVDAFDLSY